jgi:hypothetical protein
MSGSRFRQPLGERSFMAADRTVHSAYHHQDPLVLFFEASFAIKRRKFVLKCWFGLHVPKRKEQGRNEAQYVYRVRSHRMDSLELGK